MLTRLKFVLAIMGKDKLIRWAENQTFPNVFETDVHAIAKGATYMQGEWHEKAFENDKPIVLELGCGKGEYTVGLARIFPEKNFLGIDIKSHRFWRGAKTAIEDGLKNAAFLRTRIEFLDHHFNANEVDEIWLTFSDPQLKDRREKHRLSGERFLTLYRKVMKKAGLLHLKTDNTGLYEWTLEEFDRLGVEVITHSPDIYADYIFEQDKETQRVLNIRTYYETMFAEKGENIKYIRARL